MNVYLYLLVSDFYPEDWADNDSLLLVEAEMESSSDEMEISLDELSFMTTVLVNSIEPESAMENLRSWWSVNATGEFSVELLATDESQLDQSRFLEFKKLKAGEWSLKTNFVAFLRNSKKAYGEAKKIICESELCIQ